MGDIPGLEYEPPVPVDRTRLEYHDLVPEIHRYKDLDGRAIESLWWEYPAEREEDEEGTSSSPAHKVAFGGFDRELATSTLLKRLWEGVELPGEGSDYHFAIQGVAGALWSRRKTEPEQLPWIEYLCWLDIRLIRALPDAVRDDYADRRPSGSEFYGVSAFNTLISMYEREGFLQEALAVARIAGEFDQGQHQIEEIDGRLAMLRAEDGG
jgi:hypothetical protein